MLSFPFFLFVADAGHTFGRGPHHVDPVHRFFMLMLVILA